VDKALAALGLAGKVGVTEMVVQRRINTRFFDVCDRYDRSGNCPHFKCDGRLPHHSPLPGTVVDSVITTENPTDFYLVPNSAPPNTTARPTRYVIIRDDNNIDLEIIKQMTLQLCSAYLNFPGPVRVPAPLMYASKLAYLVTKYMHKGPHDSLRHSLFYL